MPPRFSIKKELKSFSIISARVATVPRPPVDFNVSANFLSFVAIYFVGFSIADKRVASLNLAGGFV
ncbi:hypothetical protein D9M71_791730 [compost metagenome]